MSIFSSSAKTSLADMVQAIDHSQAVIHFTPDGTIVDANSNFLQAMGYTLEEIQGKHHRLFVEPAEAESPAYAAFWDELRTGKFQSAQYRRIGKGGREVWIQATYTPIKDGRGRVYKVVKFASDITKLKKATHETNEVILDVTGSIQEMTKAIGDISQSTSQAKEFAEKAEGLSVETNGLMEKLLSSASSMGEVLKLIRGISDQINLLALNAAIEAARAGDAGRGFAVVADEVKRLASQAGTSTSKIAEEIQGVQHIADDVAAAMQSIQGSVKDVAEVNNTIAAAVEEQSAVTTGIAASMDKAAGLIRAM
ncbi:MAG: PAS domain S-box protein [Proteobacteria bacterium]|nr:PAS domain S-box protein [Pseudomonadota bacterium]